MVFDWFKRRAAPAAEPAGPADQVVPASPEPNPASQAASQPAAEPPSQAAPPAPPEPEVAAGGGGVDQDALDWARQAYARLKAEQQAKQEPSPTPAAAELAPELTDAPPPQQPAQSTQPASREPVEESGAGLSLLEQAAAARQQRQAELQAPELLPEPPVPGGSQSSATVPSARPAAATTGAEAPQLQLGSFDAEFSWSAEVLAAQGRRVDQVSLEEIDWLGRLRRGLEKSRQGFVSQLLDTLGDDPLTPEVLDDLETLLLRADVGVQATDQVLEALRQRLNIEVVDPAEGFRFLKEQLRGLLEQPISASGQSLLVPQRDQLNVWLLVGVNGVGKTTTLGKLANLAVRSGYSCLIAAADTFRAAAVQQVTVWGERSGVPVIANPSANADPAAVVFDAIGAAQAKGTELVLVDTAGRLQTKHNLMEELAKVRRIIDRLAPTAAVESLLVLDASQGQNGLRQAMAFASAAGLTGVVLTKLDGSARGGVALAVASEAGLPIRFVGAGEGIGDLRPFNSFEFVEALLAT